MNTKELSLVAGVEITKRYAQACVAAPGKGKTAIPDRVVEVTDWNRDRARQQLLARLKQPPGRAVTTVAMIDRRKTLSRKYSYDVRLVLQKVWAASGGSCGQYLAPAMTDWLDAMETEGALIPGQGQYQCRGPR